MTLRIVATAPSDGMNLARLNDFLSFIEARLSEAAFAEAQSLLEAAVCPVHAARRHRATAEGQGRVKVDLGLLNEALEFMDTWMTKEKVAEVSLLLEEATFPVHAARHAAIEGRA